MATREIPLAAVADLLRFSKDYGPKACLLIGAGVSKTAGVGLASDFVHRIKTDYPNIYAKAQCDVVAGTLPGYAQCMAALPPAQQVQLVRDEIDRAKINWAHIGLARLEREEVIDTILTPNFDPIASRACALFHRFPAIYDLAGLRDESENSITFDKSYVRGSAIFHLHGQHTGFLLLNTVEKLKAQAKRIRPVLNAVMKGKPVIVVGYSGENDPLIDEIAALAPFNHGLFWVCHDENDPAESVCKKLLTIQDCHVVRNMPADTFFTDLANALQLKAPGFLVDPFHHMTDVLETIRPFSDVGALNQPDLLTKAREAIARASEIYTAAAPRKAEIIGLIATGDFQEAWTRFEPEAGNLDYVDRGMIAWCGLAVANNYYSVRHRSGNTKDKLKIAIRILKRANEIDPNSHFVLNNLGNVTSSLAKISSKKSAIKIYEESHEYYRKSILLRNDGKTASNLGGSLIDLSCLDTEHAAALIEEAAAVLEKGEEQEPGSSAYNLACAKAIMGDAAACSHWLRVGRDLDPTFPSCDEIEAETNFEKVRGTSEFQKALKDIGCFKE